MCVCVYVTSSDDNFTVFGGVFSPKEIPHKTPVRKIIHCHRNLRNRFRNHTNTQEPKQMNHEGTESPPESYLTSLTIPEFTQVKATNPK